MRDSADHSPELRLKVIERIQKRAIHAEVTYSLEEMYGDDGKILQGAIDLHVFIDYEDKVQIGTGEIFQISHFMISEAYLEDFADCQSGHFLDAATWWNKTRQQLISKTITSGGTTSQSSRSRRSTEGLALDLMP